MYYLVVMICLSLSPEKTTCGTRIINTPFSKTTCTNLKNFYVHRSKNIIQAATDSGNDLIVMCVQSPRLLLKYNVINRTLSHIGAR